MINDKIFIHELKIFCIIGTLPKERKKKQPVLINLEFYAPIKKAAKTDNIKSAIDYQKIVNRITVFVSKSRFYLIETLAEKLASILLKEFALKKIALIIKKPEAIRNAKTVGIKIVRGKKAYKN